MTTPSEKYIATTRFNTKTWEENKTFREKLASTTTSTTTQNKYTCMYSVESINCQKSMNTFFFVLEMNNDTNEIMGIGLIRNKPYFEKWKMYENEKYNKFTYVGRYRIDRNEMTKEEMVILKVFENLCFKGSSHLKRLRGIKIFPEKILEKCKKIMDLNEYMLQMFKRRFS
jgi:hypothetical protein